MKKLIYLFMLIIPLSAQEAKDDPFHASIGKETIEEEPKQEETITQKAVRHIQDAEWRKFQAAHRRAHSKRGEHACRESKKHRSGWVRKAVGVVVIGGIGYYIGLNERKHRKGGWNKRKYDWGERE